MSILGWGISEKSEKSVFVLFCLVIIIVSHFLFGFHRTSPGVEAQMFVPPAVQLQMENTPISPQERPLQVQEHGALDAVDMLMYLLANNPDNRYIVVEALAGCGKTAMLVGTVARLNQKKAILMLSFTRQAVTIVNVRTNDGVHVQTFDSLFYQAVRHGFSKEMGKALDVELESYTFETFRDVSETLSDQDLQDFVGRAKSRYAMDDIQYIMVDEAQDTPPQAFAILETFRDMGKSVIVTGDRHQGIFGFMATQSLFDVIPTSQKCVRYLRTTRRCCPEMVDFLNERFKDLGMVSGYTSSLGPDVVEDVCVQAQYNATLGRVYAKFLFTMDAVLHVSVSEGDSTQKFWDAVYQETSRMYARPLHDAKAIVEDRKLALSQKHRNRHQTPRQWRTPMFTFSTIHHFKGGECDVTIVCDDVEILQIHAHDVAQERMKYVAGSRARWGLVDLKSLQWKGHAGARAMFRKAFMKCREKSATHGMAPRISSISDLPICAVPMIASPILDPWVAELRTMVASTTNSLSLVPKLPRLSAQAAMKIGSLADVVVGWMVERQARAQTPPPHLAIRCPEYKAKLTCDRKYARLRRQKQISAEVDAELRRFLARRKIQATFGRALVVFHGWSPARPIVLRAALAKSQLQSFVLCCSVLCLERTHVDLVSAIRLTQMVEQMERNGFPGILGSPETWVSVNVQQEMPPNSFFFFRGAYDLLIVDSSHKCHLVEVKTVRNVSASHVLQTLLYRTVLSAALGPDLRGPNYIYEVNRNQLLEMDPAPSLDVAVQQNDVLAELDFVLYAKVLPQYYASELSPDALVALL